MNDDQISAHLRNLSNEEFLNEFADNEMLCGPFAAEMRRRISEDLVVVAITVSDFAPDDSAACPGCEKCELEVGQ